MQLEKLHQKLRREYAELIRKPKLDEQGEKRLIEVCAVLGISLSDAMKDVEAAAIAVPEHERLSHIQAQFETRAAALTEANARLSQAEVERDRAKTDADFEYRGVLEQRIVASDAFKKCRIAADQIEKLQQQHPRLFPV